MNPPHPLFILAPPRSFTSVVCGMIGQHPDLFGLPEVNLFAGDTLSDLDRWHRVRRRLRHGLLRAVAELGYGAQGEDEIEAADAWLQEYAATPTAEIYRDLIAWAAPRRLVDKSPIYLVEDGALDRMHAAFGEARYLHMTRHPWATARSMHGLRQTIRERGGRVIGGGATNSGGGIDLETYWLRPHLRAREFLDGLPAEQWIRIRGEDLMADPDRYLPQIAEWLGVRTDADAIAAMKRPEESPFARPGPLNARFGNDVGFMESPQLRPWSARADSLDDPLPEGVQGPVSEAILHYARLWGYR